MHVQDFLSRLNKVKSIGDNKWKACCPAHDDHDPSLIVTIKDDGKINFTCWTGCTGHSILSAMGLSFSDVYPPRTHEEQIIFNQRKVEYNLAKQEEATQHELLILNLACVKKAPLSENDVTVVKQALAHVVGFIRHKVVTAHPGDASILLEEISPHSDESSDATEIARLAQMGVVEYARARKDAAKSLGIPVGTLDGLVKNARKESRADADGQGRAMKFREVMPHPYPVAGSALLTDLVGSVKQFVTMQDEHSAVAIALWTVYSYVVIDHGHIAPMLLITSPEKRCGKSTLLSWLAWIVYKPLLASNISASAVFRSIDAWAPTLIVDEADTFLNNETDELRGVLNSGHTRATAFVVRVCGDDNEPRQFLTWGSKVLAKIGRLEGKSSTLADRSIEVQLRRRLPSEPITKLRHVDDTHFDLLASKCARIGLDYGAVIGKARPDIPSVLDDRASDNWEPMLAIADIAGGIWPLKARTAAIALSGSAETAISLDIGPLLLSHLYEFFHSKQVDRAPTSEIIIYLVSLDDSPWPTWAKGKHITPRHLSGLLKPYNVHPKPIRSSTKVDKGYLLVDFKDAFSRYLP